MTDQNSASVENWIKIQEKTFKRWCNSKLQHHHLAPVINDLSRDLHDGLNLIYLIEALTEKPFPFEYFKKIKYELHCQENISLCLKFFKEHKVKTVNLDFKDIFEGNLKLILGLIWHIIKFFDMGGEGDGFSDNKIKENLMNWTNNILKEYGMSIKKLTSWGDGNEFQALIHALQRKGPEGFTFDKDIDSVKKVAEAMSIAERDHYIPRLIDPEDLIDGFDAISIMTLIATIKKEYESGPETRLKRRQQIPVAAESKFFRRPDGVGSIVEFTVELRNFEGNLVPHKQNLKDIDITASFTPKGGEEREVNAELVCVSEGVYFVALLAEEPGVYRTCVSLLDEEIGRPIEININPIIAVMESPQKIFCNKLPSSFFLKIDGNSTYKSIDVAIEFDPIFSKDSVSERAEKDEKDKKQENRKISELVPNIQILGVTPNEGAEFEVLFVGEACGKYVLSGTICGQIFANTLEIVIENPKYVYTESPKNTWAVDMKQIFEVRALNSAGEPFCAIKPKIFAKHIQNVFDLPDTKSHSGVKKSIEAIGKDILPRMKKVDEKPIKNAENAHKNGEKDAENPENVAEKEDQNLEKDSKKVEAKEVETPDKPAKKKAEKSSENPDKTADIDRKPENCEKPVERSENPPKRYINEAEDDKTVAEIAYSEKICGAEAKGEGVFEFSVLPERHGKFNVWVFVDAFNLVLFDKMYYADYEPSHKTLSISLFQHNEKIFEEITTARIAIKLATSRGKTIPVDSIRKNEEKYCGAVRLKHQLLARKSSAEGAPDVRTRVFVNAGGEMEGEFFTTVGGDYEIWAAVKDDDMESARLKVHVKRKPLWEVEGAFKSGAPGEAQTIKLTQKDLEGQPLKTDEAVHCFVQSKKTSKEEPLPCVEGEFSREFTWEARAAGLFVAYVVIKNAKTFVFDNLVIKNPYDAAASMLKHSKKESAEKSEAFKFVLFLNDAKGKTVSRGGDAKQIDVRVQVARIDQQRYDAALPASSVEGLVDNGNGSYSFTVAPGQFCEAYVVNKLVKNSPAMIKIKPPTSDLSAQTLIEIKDDRVFYEYFCRAAEKGVKVAKYRFKNNPLQKGKSEHPMSIKNPNTKDAEFVYHKFRCLLTDISNVTKGKRTEVMRAKAKGDKDLCFSLVTHQRTIDFETATAEDCSVWVRGIKLHLEQDVIKKNSRYQHLEKM